MSRRKNNNNAMTKKKTGNKTYIENPKTHGHKIFISLFMFISELVTFHNFKLYFSNFQNSMITVIGPFMDVLFPFDGNIQVITSNNNNQINN